MSSDTVLHTLPLGGLLVLCCLATKDNLQTIFAVAENGAKV